MQHIDFYLKPKVYDAARNLARIQVKGMALALVSVYDEVTISCACAKGMHFEKNLNAANRSFGSVGRVQLCNKVD
jgi:hypothetical protein